MRCALQRKWLSRHFFRGPGFIQTAISQSDAANSVALQQDGKIIAAGATRTANQATVESGIAILRYNSDGSLDQSFGSGGKVVNAVGPYNLNRVLSVVVQPDGKILVAGASTLNPGNPPGAAVDAQGFVARYLANGTLDSSFGTGGLYQMTMSHRTQAFCIALQPDGKVLLGGGIAFNGFPGASMVIRLNSDGSLDTSWNDDGIFKVDTVEDANFTSLAVMLDGRVLGVTVNNIIYRLNGDGSFDTSFNGAGFRQLALESGIPTTVLPLAGGRIMVTGKILTTKFAFSRFNPDGSLDTSFSNDGRLSITPSEGSSAGISSAAIDAYGRIVVSGYAANRFAVARLLAAPPVPVTVAGRVTRADGRPVSNILLSLVQNGITTATARTNPFGYYSFSNVMTGQQYTVLIKARGSLFPRQDIFVADGLANLDFVEGAPPTKIEGIKNTLVKSAQR